LLPPEWVGPLPEEIGTLPRASLSPARLCLQHVSVSSLRETSGFPSRTTRRCFRLRGRARCSTTHNEYSRRAIRAVRIRGRTMWKGYGSSPEVGGDAGLVQECEGLFFWGADFLREVLQSFDKLEPFLLADVAPPLGVDSLENRPSRAILLPMGGPQAHVELQPGFLVQPKANPKGNSPNAPGGLRGINPAGGGLAASQKRETVPIRQACDCRGSSFPFF
jgi:hypothetical protein